MIGLFQTTLERVVALAVLMPIVASMGGIAGSQTLTLVIRGMALGQVEGSNARLAGQGNRDRVAQRRVVGGRGGPAGGGLVRRLADRRRHRRWAILINLLFAALAGLVVPLVLERMGNRPGTGGRVILTTVTDVIGFFAFWLASDRALSGWRAPGARNEMPYQLLADLVLTSMCFSWCSWWAACRSSCSAIFLLGAG